MQFDPTRSRIIGNASYTYRKRKQPSFGMTFVQSVNGNLRTFSLFLPTLTHRYTALSHVKNLFCLPDKRGFLQLYPFLPERVIYLRYDIALRAMIYAFGIWRNGYYIMLAAGKYIIRQRRISYRDSDISLKSNIFCGIISSTNSTFNRRHLLPFAWEPVIC